MRMRVRMQALYKDNKQDGEAQSITDNLQKQDSKHIQSKAWYANHT